MNQRVEVDGEVDAGFTSYWPPDADGETVAGTTDDDKGEVRDELWPSEATEREALNADQIAVIETAAHPASEFTNIQELSETAVPERSYGYANIVLRDHWPSKHDELKGGTKSEYTCEYCGQTFDSVYALGGHHGHCDADSEGEEAVFVSDPGAADDPDGPTAAYPPEAAGDDGEGAHNAEMADERTVDLAERFIPYWVVAEAVGRAIDVEVKEIERRGESFAVLHDAEVASE